MLLKQSFLSLKLRNLIEELFEFPIIRSWDCFKIGIVLDQALVLSEKILYDSPLGSKSVLKLINLAFHVFFLYQDQLLRKLCRFDIEHF